MKLHWATWEFFATKIRCKDIAATHIFYKSESINILTEPAVNPENKKHFYIKDPWNNIFEIIEDDYWFTNEKKLTGAVCEVVIGVSDMEKSINFYSSVLGFDVIVHDLEKLFKDFDELEGGDRKCRRVILQNNCKRTGAFGKLLGPVQIELIQAMDYKPKKIYENRHWGDLGFIHVCFDVGNMKEHEKICEAKKYPLTVNSANSFDMGEAAGHFAYNEDPDGTLIEYVETHKVTVAKKLGLFLNIKNRNPEKCLPNTCFPRFFNNWQINP